MRICVLSMLLLCLLAFGACTEAEEVCWGEEEYAELTGLLTGETLAPEMEAPKKEVPQTEEPETEVPEVEQPTVQSSHVDEDGNVVWYLGKNGDNEYKVIIKPQAASSVEYNNKEKSAHSVFLYDLCQSADEPVWSMHMCVGRGPSGGIAAHENGGLYIWYTDFWEKNGELWYTLVTYDLYIDVHGKAVQTQNGTIQCVVGEDTDMWYEMKRFDLNRGILDISDTLVRDGMFVLLDVTGDEVVYSTPDNRFTYDFEYVGSYSEFRAAYENVGEFKKIVPLD